MKHFPLFCILCAALLWVACSDNDNNQDTPKSLFPGLGDRPRVATETFSGADFSRTEYTYDSDGRITRMVKKSYRRKNDPGEYINNTYEIAYSFDRVQVTYTYWMKEKYEDMTPWADQIIRYNILLNRSGYLESATYEGVGNNYEGETLLFERLITGTLETEYDAMGRIVRFIDTKGGTSHDLTTGAVQPIEQLKYDNSYTWAGQDITKTGRWQITGDRTDPNYTYQNISDYEYSTTANTTNLRFSDSSGSFVATLGLLGDICPAVPSKYSSLIAAGTEYERLGRGTYECATDTSGRLIRVTIQSENGTMPAVQEFTYL